MFRNVADLVNVLEVNIENDNFIEVCYDIVEEIEKYDNSFDAVELILKLIEANPLADFGTPGPLIHFVEKYYKIGYEEKLVESVKNSPNAHNLFMLNRVINGVEAEEKEVYLSVLDEIIENKFLDENVLTVAKGFRELH